MSQENLVNFKKGSYITIENDYNNEYFFILLKGSIRVESSVNTDILNLNRNLKPGDFFGVIPFMTGSPQIESTYALDDSVLIKVSKVELPKMLTRSNALATKIVRSFSEDLRVYDEKLVQLTFNNQDSQEEELEKKLFSNAKFYFNSKQFRIAAYILTQFIKIYADSPNVTKAIDILKTIDQEYLVALQNLKDEVRRMYLNGQMLISEFEPGYEAFIIETGKVKITKVINDKEVLLAVLKPGDIFGEMAIINNQARAASAIAYGDATCLVLNEKNFSKMIQQNANVCIKIIALLSERILTIYKQLENLTFKNVKTRIYDTLYTQMIKRKARIGPQVKFLFDFGTEELRKMVGIEQEEFDKSIKEVLAQKFLTFHEGKLLCLDTMDIKKETEFMKKLEKIQGKKQKR